MISLLSNFPMQLKTKKIILMSAITSAVIPFSVTAKEVSYYNALNQTAELSPTAQVAASRNVQQKALLDASKAGYMPKVGVSMNPGYSEGKDEVSITPEITITQSVYDFGRTSNQIEQVRAESSQISAINRQELENIIAKASVAYINAHKTFQTLSETMNHIKDIEQVVAIANDRANAGAGNESDKSQAQARLFSAKLTASQIEGEYLQALDSLKIYLNTQEDLSIAAMPDDLSDKAGLDTGVEYENIAEVKNSLAQLDVSNAQLDLAKSDSMPNIAVQLSSNKTIEGSNPNTGKKYGGDNKIQLNVSYDVYQGGAPTSRISAAAANKETSKYQLAQLKQDIHQKLSSTKIAIKQLQSKQILLIERIAVLEKTRDIYKEQYKLGSRSILDVLNVEQEVYQAITEKVNTDHDYWNALSDYIFMSGKAPVVFNLTNLTSE